MFTETFFADLAGQNHKLREKVTSLLNEARYKESLNNTLRDEVKQMLGEAGDYPPQSSSPCLPSASPCTRQAHILHTYKYSCLPQA